MVALVVALVVVVVAVASAVMVVVVVVASRGGRRRPDFQVEPIRCSNAAGFCFASQLCYLSASSSSLLAPHRSSTPALPPAIRSLPKLHLVLPRVLSSPQPVGRVTLFSPPPHSPFPPSSASLRPHPRWPVHETTTFLYVSHPPCRPFAQGLPVSATAL